MGVEPPEASGFAVGSRCAQPSVHGRKAGRDPHDDAALFNVRERPRQAALHLCATDALRQSTPILVLDIGDGDGCAWVDKGLGYTLIADEPYKELEWMLQYVRKHIGES